MLELATRPVMATHSSARALRDHHRNLTDEQIRGVAATGGVVCVNFFAGFLPRARAEDTLDRLVDHIEHVAEVAGIDHVGLGPDFVREVMHGRSRRRAVRTPTAWTRPRRPCPVWTARRAAPGHRGPARARAADKDVQKIIGGNVHRLLTELLA